MVKKGDQYRCIKDVVMDGSGPVAYIKGKVYESEYENCLTDEQGEKTHTVYGSILESEDQNFLEKHFVPLAVGEFVYDIPDQPTVGYKESDNKLSYELDFEFITQMAQRMSKNKSKYPPYNWQKLQDVEELKQALFRHVVEVMNGNYEDEGVERAHLSAIALNAMFINYHLKNK